MSVKLSELTKGNIDIFLDTFVLEEDRDHAKAALTAMVQVAVSEGRIDGAVDAVRIIQGAS